MHWSQATIISQCPAAYYRRPIRHPRGNFRKHSRTKYMQICENCKCQLSYKKFVHSGNIHNVLRESEAPLRRWEYVAPLTRPSHLIGLLARPVATAHRRDSRRVAPLFRRRCAHRLTQSVDSATLRCNARLTRRPRDRIISVSQGSREAVTIPIRI